MLTKKAFNREAVLEAYGRVRRGERVPDQELDQVTSWLKLSGIVRRHERHLQVRNAVYAQAFDERWVRDQRRLHVNWRRRLTRMAAGLLVLLILVTIPLAMFAWRQKTAAESQAREAQQQRDEATRQARIATESLATARDSLSEATKEIEALRKTLNPAVAGGQGRRRARTEDIQKRLNDVATNPPDPRRRAPESGESAAPRLARRHACVACSSASGPAARTCHPDSDPRLEVRARRGGDQRGAQRPGCRRTRRDRSTPYEMCSPSRRRKRRIWRQRSLR